jgi:ComF family protein
VSVLAEALARLSDLLYPRRCAVCDADLDPRAVDPLCSGHRREIVLTEGPFCDRCGKRMFAPAGDGLLCADCRETRRYFDRGFSATVYNDVMRALVHRFKYDMREYLAVSFARWMGEFMRSQVDVATLDAIVPVPLHWRRFHYRGFNQAVALARPLARQFSLPLISRVLRRTRHTVPQVQLQPEEREKNIRGAFHVRRPTRIEGLRLLLVDDVFTTGATLNECARVLKDAGAAAVTAFTLTRPL